MMRSMYASVSGLRAHQAKMDVIGNNIANVNTIGFRASRVTFQEIFNQTLKGASAPDPALGRGGTNPMQIGLGINVGAIDTITTRGGLQRTDNPTDLYIDGEGFFIVKGSHADTFKFTRAGNFTYDELGNLVTAGGLNVYGWLDYGGKADVDGNYVFETNKPVEPINLYADNYNGNKRIVAAKATENAKLSGNLDATTPIFDPNEDEAAQLIVPIIVYDSLGIEYEINVEFRKTAATGGITTWEWKVTSGGLSSEASGTIQFNADGKIVKADNQARVTSTITLIPNDSIGSKSFDVVLDFTDITMYAGSENSVKPVIVDGYPSGSLTSFSIGSDGIIMGIYSNGKQQPLGLIGLANFDNPAGLQRVGDNMYIPTPNSGDFKRAVKPGTASAGILNPGVLEMSNVDLAKEFTEMIVTQRGFQANTRILTTVDEMLQEMVNMKR
ncbi:MAG: flagellar hook protein FlgE [Firmicutes bacterium]|nr:flagellar hook protein FlgE [Bacillota bacterium]